MFFQGHASPGMYARAYLEGRLSEEDLNGFRQEKSKAPHGLPSYPHPRLMPQFWQFPTVSMGIGPMNAIYQAQFNRYLRDRGIKDTSDQHVWAFLGDGEMDEPESRGLLQVAANDGLDNLTFVINCNLQRLDGPVRGNGKIVQELEAFFRGAGWNVIKVLWGREWDDLLARDTTGDLVRIMNETLDGDYQTYKGESGSYIRENFFGKSRATKRLVENMTDAQIWALKRGGHDYRKVYAAYHAARVKNGRPTVVLAQTVKGYGLGANFEARNATHQMKKLTAADLKGFRDLMQIPVTDEQIDRDVYDAPYYHPGEDAPEISYMLERRRALGGFLPERRNQPNELTLPDDTAYESGKKGSGKQHAATTMAFVRLLRDLMRDKGIGDRIVPIIPDEARTFGMDSFFPTAKIYNPRGQRYTSVDRALFLAYKESEHGQLLHVGINEAGSMAAFTAAGTSYATHGEPMIPVYIFYSMFGFQRTGDFMWAAMDQMARGFIIGATAGRTTLTGEGLQHADGHSLILAATNPAMKIYDPAFGVRDLLHRAGRAGADVRSGQRRPERHVLPDGVQRADDPAGGAGGCGRRGNRARHPSGAGRQRRRTAGPAAGLRCVRPVGARGRAVAPRGVGRQRGRLVGDLLDGAAPGRAAGAEAQLPAPGRRGPRAVRDQQAGGGVRADHRDHRLRVRRAGSDPPVPAQPVRHAGCGRSRVLRHPGRRAALLPHRHRIRWWCGRCRCWPADDQIDGEAPGKAAERYQLHDVAAGTTGTAGES